MRWSRLRNTCNANFWAKHFCFPGEKILKSAQITPLFRTFKKPWSHVESRLKKFEKIFRLIVNVYQYFDFAFLKHRVFKSWAPSTAPFILCLTVFSVKFSGLRFFYTTEKTNAWCNRFRTCFVFLIIIHESRHSLEEIIFIIVSLSFCNEKPMQKFRISEGVEERNAMEWGNLGRGVRH